MSGQLSLGLSVLGLLAAAPPDSAIQPEQGSGPYPAIYEEQASLPDHVVYRPKNLSQLSNEKLGIYVFGNGGCSADGTSSRNHLLEIASRGYLVIASGIVPTGAKAPPASAPGGKLQAETPTSALSTAIDWAVRENAKAGSPLRGRIAVDQIAVSGWSCGGLQALSVAREPRVRTAVIMNSGYFNQGGSPIEGIVSDKRLLGDLHGPILYVLGGEKDIAFTNGSDDYRRIEKIPAALINIPVGHGGTYMEPHGGIGAEVVTAWLDWQLKRKPGAEARFVGAECAYCKDPRLSLQRKNLP